MKHILTLLLLTSLQGCGCQPVSDVNAKNAEQICAAHRTFVLSITEDYPGEVYVKCWDRVTYLVNADTVSINKEEGYADQ